MGGARLLEGGRNALPDDSLIRQRGPDVCGLNNLAKPELEYQKDGVSRPAAPP